MGKIYKWDPETKSCVEVGTEPTNMAHSVINDEIPPTLNHADGKYYTSKSKFRKTIKAAGCVEYGTEDILKPRKPEIDHKAREERRRAIAKIYNDLEIASGRNDKLPPTPTYSEYMRSINNGR